MPISGVLLQCAPECLDAVSAAVGDRASSQVREQRDKALIVVTDTQTLDEDRAEVEALTGLEGVVAAHVVFSSIEDL